MEEKSPIELFREHTKNAENILILQPEKPDTDSLSSGMALSLALKRAGKNTSLFTYFPIPDDLTYIPGWDDATTAFPPRFDMSVIVDTGGPQMIPNILDDWGDELSKKPFFVIDHHPVRDTMPIPSIEIIDAEMPATGEMIVNLFREMGWGIDKEIADLVVFSILADTRNLTIQNIKEHTVKTIADMISLGVDLHEINRRHLEKTALTHEQLKYKAELLQRVEFFHGGKIAITTFPRDEVQWYSRWGNPADLIIYEAQAVKGVMISATLKEGNGKINCSMRANVPVAADAAKHFGGGGHLRAAGFEVVGADINSVKNELLRILEKLIDEHIESGG